MKIERKWAMPNKWTFIIKPISRLLTEEMGHYGRWIDPFAGLHSPAYIQNDINPKMCRKFPESFLSHYEDALDFLKRQENEHYFGVLYDPPYSITQARQYGKKEYASMKYWADCKNEVARIIKPGGKAICFGWNSMGLGKKRGFKMERILLVAHGGSRNDTICTVERKLNQK